MNSQEAIECANSSRACGWLWSAFIVAPSRLVFAAIDSDEHPIGWLVFHEVRELHLGRRASAPVAFAIEGDESDLGGDESGMRIAIVGQGTSWWVACRGAVFYAPRETG